MPIKKNISLIVGLAIPIVMVILIALSIYLPKLWAEGPKYDFIYSDANDYSSEFIYDVVDGKVTKHEANRPDEMYKPPVINNPKLYYYDVESDSSKEISLEDAQKYNLDSNQKSPDGFEVVRGNNSGGVFPFFFDGGFEYNTLYIRGGHYTKKINVTLDPHYYYNFKVLGWVK